MITEGTIAYAFTFDTGFKLLWLDSAGPVTDGDRALAQRLGPVDIAIIAYQGHPVAETQVPVTLELVKLFRPRISLLLHHDKISGLRRSGCRAPVRGCTGSYSWNPDHRAAAPSGDVLRHPEKMSR